MAEPRELPSVRINILKEVADPRISHRTLLWIETVKVVLVKPMPKPMIREPMAAQRGLLCGSRENIKSDPSRRQNPPRMAMVRQDRRFCNRPKLIAAEDHPTDIAVRAKPAIKAE